MSSSDSGLMSSAGLVRYFDAEEKDSIFIEPTTLVAASTLLGVAVMVLNFVV